MFNETLPGSSGDPSDNAQSEQNLVAASSHEGTPNSIINRASTELEDAPSLSPPVRSIEPSINETKLELKRLAILAAERDSLKTINPDDYTSVQSERFSELGGFYEEKDAEQIINHITIHGDNAYAAIKEKVFSISNGNFEETEDMQDALEAILQVNKFIPTTKVIQHATKTRRANKLRPFAKDALKNCVNDIFARYMFDVVRIEYKVGEKQKSEVIGYVPTFNLNCQSPL